MSLGELKEKVNALVEEIESKHTSLDMKILQIATEKNALIERETEETNNEIAVLTEEKEKVEAQIIEAEKQGVVVAIVEDIIP